MLNAFMPARRRWLAASLAAAALLSGCFTPARIQGDGPAFDRSGRFALLVEHSNGKQDAVQGGFAWRDATSHQQLDLANPLGSTLARVDVRPGQAVLTRSDGSTDTAEGPDALIDQVLGSPIPVSGLQDWLQGRLASGNADHVEKDSDGHLSRFQQNDWRVELSRYDELGPRLLRLRRTEPGRDISLRLIVDQ